MNVFDFARARFLDNCYVSVICIYLMFEMYCVYFYENGFMVFSFYCYCLFFFRVRFRSS